MEEPTAPEETRTPRPDISERRVLLEVNALRNFGIRTRSAAEQALHLRPHFADMTMAECDAVLDHFPRTGAST